MHVHDACLQPVPSLEEAPDIEAPLWLLRLRHALTAGRPGLHSRCWLNSSFPPVPHRHTALSGPIPAMYRLNVPAGWFETLQYMLVSLSVYWPVG